MNVVFDFGGVVFRWEPESIIAGVFTDPDVRRRVKTGIFGHNDWLELDRGTLPLHEAVSRGAVRTGLSATEIARFLDSVPSGLVPIPGTVDLLRRLRTAGRRLFYLSNMHVASIEHLQRTYDFWHLFEGGVVSCRIHSIKPEPEIYSHLLESCGLTGAGSVFVDDTPVNLDAAARFGFRTIRFVDPPQCERDLAAMGYL